MRTHAGDATSVPRPATSTCLGSWKALAADIDGWLGRWLGGRPWLKCACEASSRFREYLYEYELPQDLVKDVWWGAGILVRAGQRPTINVRAVTNRDHEPKPWTTRIRENPVHGRPGRGKIFLCYPKDQLRVLSQANVHCARGYSRWQGSCLDTLDPGPRRVHAG